MAQLLQTRAQLAQRYGVLLQPVLLADSRGALFDSQGLAPGTIETVLAAKARGQSFSEHDQALCGLSPLDLIQHAADHGVETGIVVDASASEGLESALSLALDQGYGVVLANKRPLAGAWAVAGKFFEHPHSRFEATVGAGLPIVNTLRYLVDTGDVIRRIEGALSGTLGYLCSRLEDGVPFSAVVKAAKELEYTEPDPRDDLSGIDVARKVLILGRLAGWPLELSDLHVDPLFPTEMAELSLAEFMAALPRLDADFAAYMGTLMGVPRYMAEIKSSGGDVSLRMVGERLAAQLRGPLNQVSFWTERYSDLPLTVSGPGGGMQVTGAAVLEDCLLLAQRL
jgi:homoserine dehydrogenase